jgi:SAM-dependent methyltransferase
MSNAIASAVHAFSKSLQLGAQIVDVGCGLQPYRKYFAHAQYVGIDVEASGRKEQEKSADIYFDGVNIPLAVESVDAVLCTEVLEHAVDPEALVAEFFRVLRPGGQIFITVPFIWGLHELPYDFRRYTPFGLERLVVSKGFVVKRLEKLVSGAPAIRALIDSELNNFLVNVQPADPRRKMGGLRLKIAIYLHERLLRILERIWRSSFRFERVYLDNLLVACKP